MNEIKKQMYLPDELTKWAEKLLHEKAPHMFIYDRWRIGWNCTLQLMGLARKHTIEECAKRADIEYGAFPVTRFKNGGIVKPAERKE